MRRPHRAAAGDKVCFLIRCFRNRSYDMTYIIPNSSLVQHRQISPQIQIPVRLPQNPQYLITGQALVANMAGSCFAKRWCWRRLWKSRMGMRGTEAVIALLAVSLIRFNTGDDGKKRRYLRCCICGRPYFPTALELLRREGTIAVQ